MAGKGKAATCPVFRVPFESEQCKLSVGIQVYKSYLHWAPKSVNITYMSMVGGGRSRSLACLPTARGTVAPTRGQVPGQCCKVKNPKPGASLWRRALAGFFQGGS